MSWRSDALLCYRSVAATRVSNYRKKRGTSGTSHHRRTTRRAAALLLILLSLGINAWCYWLLIFRLQKDGDGKEHLSREGIIPFVSSSTKTESITTTIISSDTTTAFSIHTAPQLSSLPDWMQEYFVWHKVQREKLNTDENWKKNDNFHFLISRCLDIDSACGGVSDRLKSLPTLLWLAYKSKRILLFHWTRPALLENFLLPNLLNWTVPTEFGVPVKGKGTRLFVQFKRLIKNIDKYETYPIICTRLQDQHGGSEYYNVQFPEIPRAFRNVFRLAFFAVFAPTPNIQQRVDDVMTKRQLESGQYVAAHLRAFYGDRKRPQNQMNTMALNAVHCASQLKPTTTISRILFVADSSEAMENVEKHFQDKEQVVTVMSHSDGDDGYSEPLHLDKAESTTSDDYASIFVDLMLLAHARCISHGQGGFGRFGVLLSHDPMCFQKYIDQARVVPCDWREE